MVGKVSANESVPTNQTARAPSLDASPLSEPPLIERTLRNASEGNPHLSPDDSDQRSRMTRPITVSINRTQWRRLAPIFRRHPTCGLDEPLNVPADHCLRYRGAIYYIGIYRADR